jgi:protein-S-isoprenylcysteine O-methyltransferase Ste14
MENLGVFMSSKLEDFIGRAALLAFFSLVTAEQFVAFVRLIQSEDASPLVLFSRVVTLLFYVMIVSFTFSRLPAKSSAAGIQPRITAIAGTFLMSGLVVLPPSLASDQTRLLAAIIVTSGTLLAAYCLYFLGRSFSIMATARKLVTGGPYRFVRHPLYLAEAIATIGIIVGNGSALAWAIGICWFLLQFRRALNEERVLREAFPEYDSYAQKVPMLVPFMVGRIVGGLEPARNADPLYIARRGGEPGIVRLDEFSRQAREKPDAGCGLK